MKNPKPTAPTDLGPGVIQIGGPIDWFSISLGVKGPLLVPAEITALLRREPSQSWQKDHPLYREDGSLMRIPKFGAWQACLKPEETDEWDCGEAIRELLATLPNDPAIWHSVAEKYSVWFTVGLNFADSSRGFELPPDVMLYLGERRIPAGFDIYHDSPAPASPPR